ncbi:hypothetical protein BJF78_05760 [Pseudonocardia sp. CNS-139]|nr:hypothetical protein BJF78_05760 [Pseudonocardia sp. CNS-139]
MLEVLAGRSIPPWCSMCARCCGPATTSPRSTGAAYQVREDIDLAERNAACAVAVLGADDPLTAVVLSRVEISIAPRA